MSPPVWSRRSVLAGIGAGLGGAAWAGAPATSLVPVPRPADLATAVRSPPAERDILAEIGLPGLSTYVVADARTGEVLDAVNPHLLLPTASVAKFVTAEYALETLGASRRFETQIRATGPMTGGRIDGDLVLVGGGDPMLDSDDLNDMVKTLIAAGLREVGGRLLVYRGPLPLVPRIDPGQPEYLAFNPAVAGLNLNFNRVYFEWKRAGDGYATRMDARGAAVQPLIPMTRMEVVERPGPVFDFQGGAGHENWSVARGALGKDGARWLPVRHPGLYAGYALAGLLDEAGVRIGPPEIVAAVPPSTVLASNLSLPLDRIVRSMLYFSTNLIAEVLGLNATVARGHAPASLAASASHMNSWMKERFAAKAPHFADHSGLGDHSRASAADLVAALVGVGPDSSLAGLMRKAPMPKGSGEVDVRAKTGTLNFVSGLAGFARAGGRDLAFAIQAADMVSRRAIPPAERERPPGARGWATRARYQEHQLIAEWTRRYGG